LHFESSFQEEDCEWSSLDEVFEWMKARKRKSEQERRKALRGGATEYPDSDDDGTGRSRRKGAWDGFEPTDPRRKEVMDVEEEEVGAGPTFVLILLIGIELLNGCLDSSLTFPRLYARKGREKDRSKRNAKGSNLPNRYDQLRFDVCLF
jgi:hypothetical protein